MDPVTGFGLVASVIQIVTFSLYVVKKCQEIHRQGSTSEHIDLEYTTGHLVNLSKSLQQARQKPSAQSGALTGEEVDLIDLSRTCEDCAYKLQQNLRDLQAQPGASTSKVILKAAQAVWKRRSINEIQKRLEAYQSTLEVSLLHRLG